MRGRRDRDEGFGRGDECRYPQDGDRDDRGGHADQAGHEHHSGHSPDDSGAPVGIQNHSSGSIGEQTRTLRDGSDRMGAQCLELFGWESECARRQNNLRSPVPTDRQAVHGRVVDDREPRFGQPDTEHEVRDQRLGVLCFAGARCASTRRRRTCEASPAHESNAIVNVTTATRPTATAASPNGPIR